MKAFVVEKYGKSGLRAAQVPDPTIGSRDVLVRVSAASINPLDKMVRNGEFKRILRYKTPFVLGHDLAGVVTRVGADVRDHRPQAELAHDGRVWSGPAGGACRVAGAGRARAG